MNFTRVIDSLISWGVTLLAFLLPLFFLPITADFFDFNKQALLLAVTSVLLLAWLVKMIVQRTFRLTITPFTLPLALLTAVFLASAFLQAPNRLETLLDRPATFIALLSLLVIVTSNFTALTQIRRVFTAFIASATILSISAIYQFLGLSASLTTLDWLKQPAFTPAGSSLALITFILPLALAMLYQLVLVPAESVTRITRGLLLALLAAALAVTIFLILPGKPASPLFLPYPTSWTIVVDGFKTWRAGFLGTGPANFLEAFSTRRPGQFNLTNTWNVRFTTASNEPLHLTATVGLLGLLAWILLVFTVLKHALTTSSSIAVDRSLYHSLVIAALTGFALMLLLPANFLLTITSYFYLILWAAVLKVTDHSQVYDVVLRLFAAQVIRPTTTFAQVQKTVQNTEVLPWVIGLPVSAALLILWYLGITRVYAAELAFKQSLDALQANNGTQTYNLQVQAIRSNPYFARYHRAYATTNLALANALAQSKPELSTPDRQNVTQLIQQAIREGKIAAQVNPKDPANWETLANIYRNLINVAQGADSWAIAAYARAAQADPLSPRLRLELGGIYYAIGRYDEAIRAFQQATELKPDWANAYYNLAAAYKQKGELRSALNNLTTAIKLIDPAAADYPKAVAEAQDLQQQLGAAAAAPSPTPAPAATTLEKPQPAPTPNPALGNITLPESSAP